MYEEQRNKANQKILIGEWQWKDNFKIAALLHDKWLSSYQKTGMTENIGINDKLPYNPTIPLLGKYPEETKSEKDICTPMLTAALFIIARTWKQLRCPSIDKKVVVHIHNRRLFSHKKEHIWVSSKEMDEPRAYYTEWSKSESERQIPYIYIYIWNLGLPW